MATKQNHFRKSKGAARRSIRAGWAEAFTRMAAAKDDARVHGSVQTKTRFEVADWRWSGTRRQPDR